MCCGWMLVGVCMTVFFMEGRGGHVNCFVHTQQTLG